MMANRSLVTSQSMANFRHGCPEDTYTGTKTKKMANSQLKGHKIGRHNSTAYIRQTRRNSCRRFNRIRQCSISGDTSLYERFTCSLKKCSMKLKFVCRTIRFQLTAKFYFWANKLYNLSVGGSPLVREMDFGSYTWAHSIRLVDTTLTVTESGNRSALLKLSFQRGDAKTPALTMQCESTECLAINLQPSISITHANLSCI